MPVIYHAISDKNIGGGGLLLKNLLLPNMLSPHEATCRVLLPEGSLLTGMLVGTEIPYEEVNGVTDTSFSFSNTLRFFRLLTRERPALLVSHASLSARLAAKCLGIPTVSVKHCDTLLSRQMIPFYNRVTDVTVATSLPLMHHLQHAGVKKVVCIENGLIPMGLPTREEKRRARALLGISPNTLAVGLCGRLAAVKGHDTALRALAKVKEQGAYHLYFLGEGAEKERLLRVVSALSLEDRVHFLGHRTDPSPFYHAMDAHLSCSTHSETSSLSLAEGMSAALPTFATSTEGNACRVKDGGLLFPVGDSGMLSSYLLLLKDRGTALALSDAAYRRSLSLPTMEETAKKYRDLFLSLCKKGQKPKKK